MSIIPRRGVASIPLCRNTCEFTARQLHDIHHGHGKNRVRCTTGQPGNLESPEALVYKRVEAARGSEGADATNRVSRQLEHLLGGREAHLLATHLKAAREGAVLILVETRRRLPSSSSKSTSHMPFGFWRSFILLSLL